MSRPAHSWPRRLALVLLAVVATSQIATAVSSERVARRILQTGEPRRGMGWVITNFPLKLKASCDATSYHSPLVLNITRPDRSTFCFKIASMMPETVKYSCQLPPNAGQVARIQVLTAPGCGDAVAGVTVNGRSWSNYTYDSSANILSIDRIAALPPPDAANPSDHTVCIQLRPISVNANNNNSSPFNATTCGSVTSFCAPTYGPDPACAVLVADNKGICCPVNRVSYENAEVEGGLLFNLYARFTAGCESVSSLEGLQASIATQYRVALGLPRGSIQFLSYNCRGGRMAAVFRATSLTLNTPELISQRSAALLKPLATLLGLVGVRAVPYTAPPPSPLPPLPPVPPTPKGASSPLPSAPPSSPPLEPSPRPVPSHPNVPARSAPPRGDQPGPSHYASRPPPVYGVY